MPDASMKSATDETRCVRVCHGSSEQPVIIPLKEDDTAEDVCIAMSVQLGIGPLASQLFGLRSCQDQLWLPPSYKFCDALNSDQGDVLYNFRLRFPLPEFNKLRRLDGEAFTYYFYQVREDFRQNRISEVYKDKPRVLGLIVADMFRVMKQQKVPRSVVTSDYTQYFPKDFKKNNRLLVHIVSKSKIDTALESLEQIGKDAPSVMVDFLEGVLDMVPYYMFEEYKIKMLNIDQWIPVTAKVGLMLNGEPQIFVQNSNQKEFEPLSRVADLCTVSVRDDDTVELCRKDGIPIYMKLEKRKEMHSFLSGIGGYYRLSHKWTFDLCSQLPTPSLLWMQKFKCHGPVSSEFAHVKLKDKRSYQKGSFILRQSIYNHNECFIDVCCEEKQKPSIYRIKRNESGQYSFENSNREYPSLTELLNVHSVENELPFILHSCVPPSEYDQSGLLLCAPHSKLGAASVNVQDDESSSAPQCISAKTLYLYRGKQFVMKGKMTLLQRARWHRSPRSKVEVILKTLLPDFQNSHLQDFIELANRSAFHNCSALISLYGIRMASPMALVMEYLYLGPLDVYLREHQTKLMPVDLVEAGTYLAKALWHLEELRIVHGKIRCRKVLVAAHDPTTFRVKLNVPGLSSYTDDDVHWIPVELLEMPTRAQSSFQADVWAFGTTLWEIFSYGALPKESGLAASQKYRMGHRLAQPSGCNKQIYRLMCDCWNADWQYRKQPQAIMRDINHFFYELFNSRKTNEYETIPEAWFSDSNAEQASAATDISVVPDTADPDILFTGSSLLQSGSDMSYLCRSTSVTSIESSILQQEIFFLEKDQIEIWCKLGDGCYGVVYQAKLKCDNGHEELVAVKKLKTSASSEHISDMKREIDIMKALSHPNIVSIRGVVEDEQMLVMELISGGSLITYLKTHKDTVPNNRLIQFAFCIAEGMEYLGNQNIVHRDLAARNILVVSDDHVKISDFGLAQFMGESNYYKLKTERQLPLRWYALESIKFHRFSKESDVWSYGVTLFEMFSRGESPQIPGYADNDQVETLIDKLEAGVRLPCPANCPEVVYSKVMKPCWQKAPSERPKFKDLKALVDKIESEIS